MQGSVRNSTDLTVVSDLLTYPRQPLSSCRWNISLVRSLYSEPIANCILSLPISITNSKDSLTWTKSASGSYSAKEGFSLLFDNKFQNQPALTLSRNSYGPSLCLRSSFSFCGSFSTKLSRLQMSCRHITYRSTHCATLAARMQTPFTTFSSLVIWLKQLSSAAFPCVLHLTCLSMIY